MCTVCGAECGTYTTCGHCERVMRDVERHPAMQKMSMPELFRAFAASTEPRVTPRPVGF